MRCEPGGAKVKAPRVSNGFFCCRKFSWCARVLRLRNRLEPGRDDGADDDLQRVLQQQRRAEHREVGPACEDDLEEGEAEGERLVARAHDEGDAVPRLQCTRSAAQR